MAEMETTPSKGEPIFDDVRVGDVMTEGVVSCSPDTPLREVAALMVENRIHSVVVYEGGPERAWRIVSDIDLVNAANADMDREQASEVAATPVVTVTPDARLGRVAQLMAEYQTAHLVVVDPGSGRPVGVISSLDLARTLAER